MRDYRGQHVGPARAAGGQPQGRLHRPGQVGQDARPHPSARGRRIPAHLDPWPRLDRFKEHTHGAARWADLVITPEQRGRAARTAEPRRWTPARACCTCCSPLDGLAEPMEGGASGARAWATSRSSATKRACPQSAAPATPSWTRASFQLQLQARLVHQLRGHGPGPDPRTAQVRLDDSRAATTTTTAAESRASRQKRPRSKVWLTSCLPRLPRHTPERHRRAPSTFERQGRSARVARHGA